MRTVSKKSVDSSSKKNSEKDRTEEKDKGKVDMEIVEVIVTDNANKTSIKNR